MHFLCRERLTQVIIKCYRKVSNVQLIVRLLTFRATPSPRPPTKISGAFVRRVDLGYLHHVQRCLKAQPCGILDCGTGIYEAPSRRQWKEGTVIVRRNRPNWTGESRTLLCHFANFAMVIRELIKQYQQRISSAREASRTDSLGLMKDGFWLAR